MLSEDIHRAQLCSRCQAHTHRIGAYSELIAHGSLDGCDYVSEDGSDDAGDDVFTDGAAASLLTDAADDRGDGASEGGGVRAMRWRRRGRARRERNA